MTADKACRALLDGRIRVLKRTDSGLALECQSATRATSYVSAVFCDEIGVRASCTCPNGRVHPVRPRCWHAAAARLLSDFGEGSAR